ncbi:M24 family metallopeptidase [Haloplanus halophilus]|uniref:M24 family metallopeptidase n=1 Tax=Haloplanus halophilus TaxID=2949993 RepID=UPI00203BEC5C|nr:Xaa-Pro peptidase family protein [Haloplanus sp. GDY1]
MTTPFERRTRRAQSRLRALGADALALSPGRDLYYLSGVDAERSDRLTLLVVPADGDPTFVVPGLEAGPVRAATWVDDVRTWADETGPDPVLDPLLDTLSPSRVLLADRMWAAVAHSLRERLPEASFGLASEVLAPLRRRKDDAELDALRAAAGAADATMEDVRALGVDAVGRTEADLAAFVEDRLAAHGGTGVAFDTIVAAGPNGADPHHASGDREIRPGDPVVLDFGTRVDGYVSDQTRTVVFDGDPPAAFEDVHRVVREAQAAGVDAVEPGASTGAVDRAARSVVEAAGYGDRFVHRTGHGVGLDVHESPDVVAGGDVELEPGMVFSVEPGVYLPDRFGVRIEDLVVVTESGAERLNRTDRGWRP